MTDAVRSFMDKKAVAQVLEQIAAFLELKGENPFRIRAFRTAARAVAGFPADLRDGLDDGSLASTKGVGPATLQIVSEIVTTGRASLLEELREQIPPGLVEMLSISGLGVAKIRQIHEVLDIDSVPELEAAALDGRLARLPRFGPKTSENILKGIAFMRQASAYRLLHHAADEAEGLRAALERMPGVLQAVVAGDVRRRAEVVRDLVLVIVAEVPPGELFKRLSQLPGVHEFAGQDERRMTLRFAGGASAQIVVTTPVNTGAVLAQATGSEAHLRELAAHAASRGLALSGAALWRGSTFMPTPDETSFYSSLGLDFVPPELREGQGEVEAAAGRALPRLLERSELRGFLHCHTRYSDGSNTVEELALACRAAGYEYVGITDHSQAELNWVVQQTGDVPIAIWYGVTANADSGRWRYPGYGNGTTWGLSTESARGQRYQADIQALASQTAASTGAKPYVGLMFWQYLDNFAEQTNWGLVSLMDNAYNGKEAITATGSDPWGFVTGGEEKTYTNFLDYVTTTNGNVYSLH